MSEPITSNEEALEVLYQVSNYLQRMYATALNDQLVQATKWYADKAAAEENE